MLLNCNYPEAVINAMLIFAALFFASRAQNLKKFCDIDFCDCLILKNLNPTYLEGGGQNDPQRNKCLRNSENRKKIFKKTTNYNKKFCTLLKKKCIYTFA